MILEEHKKWDTVIHDINSTLSAMENAMNGAIANPNNKEQYRALFEKGKSRILSKIKSLMSDDCDPMSGGKGE